VFTRTRAKLGASKLRTSRLHRVEFGPAQKKSSVARSGQAWGLTA
jgi:hypothetical protein